MAKLRKAQVKDLMQTPPCMIVSATIVDQTPPCMVRMDFKLSKDAPLAVREQINRLQNAEIHLDKLLAHIEDSSKTLEPR